MYPFLIIAIIISYMVRLTLTYLSHQYLFMKSGIRARQMMNWNKAFENHSVDGKVRLSNKLY